MKKILNGNKCVDFDFHIHTMPGSKDAKQTVAQMLETAKYAGITTVAITDHNKISSLKEAGDLAIGHGVTLVPGIEMSVFLTDLSDKLNGEIIHILGLGIKPDEQLYEELSHGFKARVNSWMRQIIRAAENYFHFTSGATDVWKLREELVEYKFFENIRDAKEWTRTFNDGSIDMLTPFYTKESIEIIHKMGGVAVLAHPNRGERHRRFNLYEVREIVDHLVDMGLDGLEVYHKDVVADAEVFNELNELCKKHDLLKSLGSDRHFAFDYYGDDYFIHNKFLEEQDEDFEMVKLELMAKINLQHQVN